MVLKPVASMSKALRERKQQKMTKESLEVSDDLSKWCWAPVVIWFIDWTKTTFDFYWFIYLFIYFCRIGGMMILWRRTRWSMYSLKR